MNEKKKRASCFRTASGRPLARPYFGVGTMIAASRIERGDAVVTMTPRQFKALQAAFYEAAVRFADAHAECDRLDNLCDGSEELTTDAQHNAATDAYNKTKAAMLAAYRRLVGPS